MNKISLILSTLFVTIGLAESFDPTKLPNEEFATIANVMGMTTVFVVLAILSLVIAITGKIINLGERKKEKNVKEYVVQTIIKEPKNDQNDDEDVAAAIFASIYTMLGHKNFKFNYKSSNSISTWKRLSMNKINNRRTKKW